MGWQRERDHLYILGETNARIQKAEGRREEAHIGKYTFEPETASRTRSDMVQQNRSRLIHLCQTNNLRIMNTMLKKEKDKLATYAEVGTPLRWPKTRDTHMGMNKSTSS